MDLFQWLDTWLSIYKAENVKKATLENYKYAVNLIKKNSTDSELSTITDMSLQLVLNTLYQKGFAKSTIRLVKLTLTQAFRKALKQHYIIDNPADELIIPIQAVEKEVNALTRAEQEEIIRECKTDMYGDVMMFLMQTGLRKSECCNLKWSDYNSSENYIRIIKSKTKNGIRIVPLSKTAKIIIEQQPQISEYVFVQKKSCKPLTKTVLRRVCERMEKHTGIKITPHICRHTFATRVYEISNDVKSLSELLGHSNVSFTIQRYVSSDLERKRKIVSML